MPALSGLAFLVNGAAMRTFLLALSMTMLITAAYPQGMPRNHFAGQQKTEEPRKREDDTTYNSVLRAMPNRKYDPWQGAR